VAHLEIDEAPDERPMTLGRRNVAEPRPGKDFCADIYFCAILVACRRVLDFRRR
jgi:hypothetical protein